MAQKWPTVPSCVRQREVTPENHAAKVPCDLGRERQHLWPGQRQIETPGSNRVTHSLAIPWNVEAILGMAQRQHLGSCKSIWTEKGKKWTSQGRRLRNLPYNPIGEAVARGQWSLFCFNHYVPDTVHGSCLAGGGCPCGLIHSMSPLSSHGSLHVAGALMAFKCLTHAHTILVGLVLS